jgi:hexosaminidase
LKHRSLAVCALALAGALFAPITEAAAQTSAAKEAPSPVNEFASAAKLQLRWELQRNLFTDKAPHGRSQARLILTNHDTKPLPPQGWSLYFNVVGRPESGELPSGLIMEHLTGGLFRLRPGPGFAGVAPGQTLDIVYTYPDLVIKLAKAPAGPYLVYDATPEQGVVIRDFALLPVTRPQQRRETGGDTRGHLPRQRARRAAAGS